jgi:hypothetical protein
VRGFFIEEHVNVKVWSTGQITRTITATVSGNYSVTVTDPNGCAIPDNVVITVNPVIWVPIVKYVQILH